MVKLLSKWIEETKVAQCEPTLTIWICKEAAKWIQQHRLKKKKKKKNTTGKLETRATPQNQSHQYHLSFVLSGLNEASAVPVLTAFH